MKRIILLFLPILIVTGCSNKEQTFRKYAKEYYESYMKMIDNVDEVVITLDDLMSASSEGEYDLSGLKKCEKSSKVTFYIEKDTKVIKNEKIELKC